MPNPNQVAKGKQTAFSRQSFRQQQTKFKFQDPTISKLQYTRVDPEVEKSKSQIRDLLSKRWLYSEDGDVITLKSPVNKLGFSDHIIQYKNHRLYTDSSYGKDGLTHRVIFDKGRKIESFYRDGDKLSEYITEHGVTRRTMAPIGTMDTIAGRKRTQKIDKKPRDWSKWNKEQKERFIYKGTKPVTYIQYGGKTYPQLGEGWLPTPYVVDYAKYQKEIAKYYKEQEGKDVNLQNPWKDNIYINPYTGGYLSGISQKKEAPHWLKEYGAGFAEIPVSFLKGGLKFMRPPRYVYRFVRNPETGKLESKRVDTKGEKAPIEFGQSKWLEKEDGIDPDMLIFAGGVMTSMLPWQVALAGGYGFTGYETVKAIQEKSPKRAGRATFMGLTTTVGTIKHVKSRFNNQIKNQPPEKQAKLKELLKIAEEVDAKTYRNLEPSKIEALRHVKNQKGLNNALNQYFSQNKDIVAGGTFAQRTQINPKVVKNLRLPQDGDLYINMKNHKIHTNNIMNILRKYTNRKVFLKKDGTIFVKNPSGESNAFSFHDLTKIQTRIERFNPVKAQFYKHFGLKRTPDGTQVLNLKYQAKNKIFGAMYERYKLKRIDIKLMNKKIKQDYKDFYDILESSKQQTMIGKFLKSKKGTYYGGRAMPYRAYGLPMPYTPYQYPYTPEVTGTTPYQAYYKEKPKKPLYTTYTEYREEPTARKRKMTYATTPTAYEDTTKRKARTTISEYTEEMKRKELQKRFGKKFKKLTAFRPVFYDENKNEQRLPYYLMTYDEATREGMFYADETYWNKFYIEREQVAPTQIRKPVKFKKTYKFKQKGRNFIEKRYHRFDKKGEKNRKFNIFPFIFNDRYAS